MKGGWYHALSCKGCGKLIYALEDTSKGTRPLAIPSDGEISVPCLRCGCDEIYQFSQLQQVQSKESLAGGRPERVKASKASRSPLRGKYRKAKAIFGVGYIEDRPKAAATVGRIITSWADIERQCARLLGQLMGVEIPAAAAVFGSLRSGRTQHDALAAAAKVALNNADYDLFEAYMMRRGALEKERNDLAHGCFGVSVTIPEGIIWASQADYLTFSASLKHDPDALKNFRAKQAVYELGTLERIAQEIEGFYNQLGLFIGYVHALQDGPNGQAFRAEQYPQLCNQPHIREALGRVRTAKK